MEYVDSFNDGLFLIQQIALFFLDTEIHFLGTNGVEVLFDGDLQVFKVVAGDFNIMLEPSNNPEEFYNEVVRVTGLMLDMDAINESTLNELKIRL